LIDAAGNLLTSLFVLATVLCITAIALLGWGRLILKLIGFEQCPRPDTVTVWLGFGIVLGVIDFLHLFFPVDWKMSVCLGLIGLLGCNVGSELNDRTMIAFVRTQLRKYWFFAIAGGLILVLWCLRAMGVPNNFDSGLYHFQTIRWLNEYPLVPGLGNLHWRFALNQSYFNFLALLNIDPYWGKGYAAGGLFLLLLSVLTLLEFAQKQTKTWCWIFGGAIFMYFGYVASGIANPAPDGVIGLVQITVFLLLFKLLDSANQYSVEDSSQRQRDITTLLLLCLTMTTIKLTGALFALACIVIVLWKNRNVFRQYPKKWLILSGILLLLMVVHFGRGYLLSGFPLFPGLILAAHDLPWSLPTELVKFESDLIKSWARMPGTLSLERTLSSWAWVPVWFKAMSFGTFTLLGCALVLMVIGSALVFVNKMRSTKGNLFLLYLPLYATLIFWFVTAPDPRFLGSILVLCIALSGWFWVTFSQSILKDYGIKLTNGKLLSRLGCIVCCLVALKLSGLSSISLSGWKNIPTQDVEVKQTLTGLEILVPNAGGQCWNEALPCASIFNQNLAKQKNILFPGLSQFGLMNNFYFIIKGENRVYQQVKN